MQLRVHHLTMSGRSPTMKRSDDERVKKVAVRLPTDAETAPAKKQAPLLCTFPRGLPSALDSDSGAETGESKLQLNWEYDKVSDQQVLTGNDESCRYTAPKASNQHNTGDKKNSSSHSSTRMCVGVYDKKRKTLTLHDVGHNGYIYPLQQAVTNYKLSFQSEHQTAAEIRRMLFEDFGSAKKRKVLRSQEANRVDVDTVVGAGSLIVDSLLQGESMSESNKKAIQASVDRTENGDNEEISADDEALHQWRTQFLPPFNLDAKDAISIYQAQELCGGEECWNFIKHVVQKNWDEEDLASAIIDPKKRSDEAPEVAEKPSKTRNDLWLPSVISVFERAAGLRRETQVICAFALHCMTRLYKVVGGKHFAPPVDRQHYFTIHNTIATFFLKTFTTETIQRSGKTGHVMSKPMKDKCCIYILLLLLIAYNGDSMSCPDIEPLVNDLQLDIRHAT